MQRLWNGKLAIVLFVLVASYAPVEVFAQPISPSANSVKIERIVAEVRAEQDIGKRTNLIQKLAIDLQYVDSSSIDDEAIDAITQLLLDRDDSVVNWAAGALGNIGPRAKHAIPALEQAQAIAEMHMQAVLREHGFITGVQAADTIRYALNKIRSR